MCCEPRSGRKAFAVWACGPECCGTPFFRSFASSKERREWLEEYKAQLEKELAGVEERIQDLEGN